MATVSESAFSIAANAKSTDRLSGSALLTSPGGTAQLACKASATGLNVSLFAGGELIVDDQPIPFTGTAGTIAFLDNLVESFESSPGERLQLFFRNTTGGAITVDYILKVQ